MGAIERGEVWTQKVFRPLLKYVIRYVLAWHQLVVYVWSEKTNIKLYYYIFAAVCTKHVVVFNIDQLQLNTYLKGPKVFNYFEKDVEISN